MCLFRRYARYEARKVPLNLKNTLGWCIAAHGVKSQRLKQKEKKKIKVSFYGSIDLTDSSGICTTIAANQLLATSVLSTRLFSLRNNRWPLTRIFTLTFSAFWLQPAANSCRLGHWLISEMVVRMRDRHYIFSCIFSFLYCSVCIKHLFLKIILL